ncbi:MAG: M3 family metallopeptidase [Verrucomicrobia bacterium]|jgi:oligopeptidase A|nr:M3 family metallopeptidase [Verrucomicrobiota bacterium]
MSQENPLLLCRELPLFNRIRPEHAKPAIDTILSSLEPALADLEATVAPTWDGCMLPMRDLFEPLDFAWGIISHLHSVMNTPAWREIHDELQPRIVELSLRASQSEPIYQALKTLRDSGVWASLSTTQQRIVESSLLEAELAGVGLPHAERKRFNALKQELAQITTNFSNNVLDATKAYALQLKTNDEIVGLPQSLLIAASEAAKRTGSTESTPTDGPWAITLEMPLFGPFMQYSQRRDHRETLYRAYISRASSGSTDNTPLIDRILSLRQEIAALLGYETYAEVSLSQKMADSVEEVDTMVERLRSVAFPVAKRELEELESFASNHGQNAPLMNWDTGYWSESMREARFGFTDEDLRPYFQFPRVLEGLFGLANRIFGITISAPDTPMPVWHEDVMTFVISDDSGAQIASFYLDPYSRPETKRGGAWLNPMRPRCRKSDGTTTLPAAYIVCNQTRPTREQPSLMTFSEVTTLFHEFGHALHHLLTTVDEPEAAGLHNVEWDAVELPSQFMENWCYHRPALLQMSRHIKTQQPLPDELYQKICDARTFRAASASVRQLLFAALDIELHHRYSPGSELTPQDIKQRIAAEFSPIPFLDSDRFLCGFTHIFAGGYAAGYYSYKWAEVLSADAFEAFIEAGVDDPEATATTGRRFRNTILALGGSQHPMDVFKAFRGRPPDPDALLRHDGLLNQTE